MARKNYALAVINILCPGMAQILIGKTLVGLIFNIITMIAYVGCISFGGLLARSSSLKPTAWFFLFTIGAMTVLSLLDAILSIRFGRVNGEVHAFQLFPVARSKELAE